MGAAVSAAVTTGGGDAVTATPAGLVASAVALVMGRASAVVATTVAGAPRGVAAAALEREDADEAEHADGRADGDADDLGAVRRAWIVGEAPVQAAPVAAAAPAV